MEKLGKVRAIVLSIILIFTIVEIGTYNEDYIGAKGQILYVGGAGSGNYTKIQDAINAANPGNTIFVYNGIYIENLIISKSINLIGESKNFTIIDGNFINDVLYIDSNSVKIEGFTIKNSRNTFGDAGIFLKYVNNCDIFNNNISDNEDGIRIDESTNIKIINNVISNNDDGIDIWKSNNIKIEYNYVELNQDDGIFLDYSSNNYILNNNITDNSYGLYFQHSSNNNSIKNNNLSENGRAIYFWPSTDNNSIINNNISSNNGYGMYLKASTNNKIKNNYLYNNSEGIYFINSSNNNITNNNIIDNRRDGIYFTNPSTNNYIAQNKILLNGDHGIYFTILANKNEIIENNISKNELGIHIESPENKLYNNSILLNNDYGIELETSNYNKVINNKINYNSGTGIRISTSSSENLVRNNEIINNFYGVVISSSSNNNNVSSNKILMNDKDGIYISYSSNNYISNIISNNDHGIRIYESPYNKIISNKIIDCNYGVKIDSSTNIIASNNTFKNHGFIIVGDDVIDFNSHEITINNLVNNEPIYYYKNYNLLEIDNVQMGQLIVVNCKSTNIKNLKLNDTDIGLELAYSENSMIYGINILNNNYYGLFIWESSNISISHNNIFFNENGIMMHSSSDNNIINNNISLNKDYGIYITNSLRNIIFHNNLINNKNQSYDNKDNNFWNNSYPFGGNYWSDHSPDCLDLFNGSYTPQTKGKPDGICDLSYKIDSDSLDYYPLKNPWNFNNSVPSSPIDLEAISGDSNIELSWNEPVLNGNCSIIKYYIYKSTEPGKLNWLTEVESTTIFNDVDVTNGIIYYYKISAINFVGEGPLSIEINCTPFGIPSQPRNIKITTGDSFIDLKWDSPTSDGGSPITNYIIYRNSSTGEIIFYTEINNINSYNDTNVISGVLYKYRISAKNVIGEGTLSKEINGIPATIPSEPLFLKVHSGDSFIKIFWELPDSNGGVPITNYKIYKGISYDEISYYIEVSDNLFFNDTNVKNDITYCYKISAINAIGEGPLSEIVYGTPFVITSKLKKPYSPTGLMFTKGIYYVNLSWNYPSYDGGSPIINYLIYRDSLPTSNNLLAKINNVTYYNDSDVAIGKTYYYSVSAMNIVGEGDLSQEINLTFYLDNNSNSNNNRLNCFISYPEPGSMINGEYNIFGTASTSNGSIKKVEIKIDNGTWFQVEGTTSWSYLWDTTKVENGLHTISARAFNGTNYSLMISIEVFVNNTSNENPSSPEEKNDSSIIIQIMIIIVSIILIIIIIVCLLILRKKKMKKQLIDKSSQKKLKKPSQQEIQNEIEWDDENDLK